jgi:hypothetical protein
VFWTCLLTSVSPSLAAESFKIARLIPYPASVDLIGAGAEHRLIVLASDDDGRIKDVTRLVRYSSARPEVIAVTNGVLHARADGSAEIAVAHGGKAVKVLVTARGTQARRNISFRQDIEPVLTRAGCNMGACHGKLAGQNGFKLSLRGYAPELDYFWLTSDLSGRRINPAFPEESLLLLKALGKVPHEGRQRFAERSLYHQMLAGWIGARAPGPDTNETDAARLEIFPGNRTWRVGETQQLLARAHDTSGRVRDVTWLAQFFSNDEGTVTVTPEGLVTAKRHGETAVRAHFQGLVEVITLSIPYENKVARRDYGKRYNAVDDAVLAKLEGLRLPLSGECDDATFLRRASLDATGTLPTAEQVRAFVADKSRDKRARRVDLLLAAPEFVTGRCNSPTCCKIAGSAITMCEA